jgi:hypothetical protein
MSSPFTDSQLQEFWNTYHTMSEEQVRIATTPGQDGYFGPEWSAMLSYVFQRRLFGFGNYLPLPGHVAGENQGGANTGIFNGPIKS